MNGEEGRGSGDSEKGLFASWMGLSAVTSPFQKTAVAGDNLGRRMAGSSLGTCIAGRHTWHTWHLMGQVIPPYVTCHLLIIQPHICIPSSNARVPHSRLQRLCGQVLSLLRLAHSRRLCGQLWPRGQWETPHPEFDCRRDRGRKMV